MFVKNTITVEGENVAQDARDKVAFLKQAGIPVISIKAHGDFEFQGKLPLSYDEDDPQDVALPIGRKLMRIGKDGGLGCVPTDNTVVTIETVVEGEEYDEADEVVDLLDALDPTGRKALKVEAEDETDE